MKKRKIYFVILILWIGFIWGHSMRDAVQSTAESNIFINILATLGIEVSEFFIRKLAHLTEYAVVGILLGKNLSLVRGCIRREESCSIAQGFTSSKEPRGFIKSSWNLIESTLFSGLLIAMIDETIQMFSKGRSCEVRDVWIDFAGVCLGTAMLLLIKKIHRDK